MSTTTLNKFRKALTGILVIGAGFLISPAYGQAPQAIKYQGVARDNVGNELTFQNLGLRLSIVTDSVAGTEAYVETHSTTTNEFGLFNVELGNGAVVTGSFPSIAWGTTTHYLKVEMDETGGTSYQEMGTSQLLAVPYALYADSAGAAPGSAPQTLTFAGGSLSISGGNMVTLPDSVNDFDADTLNEIQNLVLAGSELWITGGDTVTLPDNVDDLDADTLNEIQSLTLLGNDLSITGGNTVTLSSTAPSDTSLYADSADFTNTAGYAWYADMAGYADTATYAWSAGSSDTANFAYDADTANFAWLAAAADSAYFAFDADTANYAWSALNADTANIAFAAGFANLAQNANYADTAKYADTAGFALGPWGKSGDTIFYTQGNVGIGTNTPGAKLDIRINSTIPSLKLSTEGDFNPMVDFNRTNSILYTDRRWWTGLVGAGGFQIRDATANVPRMVIDTSGNVGIGTNTPGARLHVTSAADPVLFERTGSSNDNRFRISMTNQALGGASNATADQTINLLASGAPGHTGDMAFSANADNTNTGDIQMIITNAGKVGIGTTNPYWSLALEDSADYVGMGINNKGVNGSFWDILSMSGGAVNPGGLTFSNAVDRMVIDSAGNVGIGTANPSSSLSVSGGGTFGSSYVGAAMTDGEVAISGALGIGITTPFFPLHVQTSTADRTAYFINSTNTTSTTFGLYAGAFGAGSGDNIGAHFDVSGGTGTNTALSAYATGGSVNWAGYFVGDVYASGNVGIGTTTPNYALDVEQATTSYAVKVNNTTTAGGYGVFSICEVNNNGAGSRYGGYFRARYGTLSMIGVYGNANGGSAAYGVFGTAAGSSGANWAVYSNGSSYATGTWQASDSRLKINVAGFDGALSRIGQLPVKTYHFDNEKHPTLNFPTQKQYGIMAQDLEKVFPEMVLESDHYIPDENGELTEETVEIKAVNYVQLIPVLVKAVQEQQVIIESQKDELETLKEEMSEMKSAVRACSPKNK